MPPMTQRLALDRTRKIPVSPSNAASTTWETNLVSPGFQPGRRLGLEQRRPDRERRRVAARRHAVRPPQHARDARCDEAGTRMPPPTSTGWSTPTRTATTPTATNSSPAPRSSRPPPLPPRWQQPRRRALAALMRGARANGGLVGDFLVECFGSFDFEGITHTPPNRTFDGQLTLTVGRQARRTDRSRPCPYRRRHHGPRARRSDSLHRRHPVHRGRADHLGGTRAELDRRLRSAAPNWDLETIVPGHGPITDKRGVEAMRAYLVYLRVTRRGSATTRGSPRARRRLRHRPRRLRVVGGGQRAESRSTSTRCTASSGADDGGAHPRGRKLFRPHGPNWHRPADS